jgi:predicted amidophosphoribosyltransferase
MLNGANGNNVSFLAQSNTKYKTRKTRYNRWENVEGIFTTNKPAFIANKKVILVDDVITTGSTLEALATSILGAKPSKLGLVSLAVAKN